MTKEEKIKKIIGFMDNADFYEDTQEEIERVADVTPDGLEELAALLLDCQDDTNFADDIMAGCQYVIWPYEDLSWGFKWSLSHGNGLTPAEMYRLFPEDCPENFNPCGDFWGEISMGVVQVFTACEPGPRR